MYSQDLDKIIKTRKSIRQFKDEVPEKESIIEIIEAGRLAPYAGLPNKGTFDFRKFFVFSKNNENINEIKSLITKSIKKKIEIFEKSGEQVNEKALKVLNMVVKLPPQIGNAPWYIIVAERKGFPAREEQALAHCMENMWLKATSLGFGFQLISAINDLQEDARFNEMLGLNTGEFAFDSCMVGYPVSPLSENVRVEPKLSIEWFE